MGLKLFSQPLVSIFTLITVAILVLELRTNISRKVLQILPSKSVQEQAKNQQLKSPTVAKSNIPTQQTNTQPPTEVSLTLKRAQLLKSNNCRARPKTETLTFPTQPPFLNTCSICNSDTFTTPQATASDYFPTLPPTNRIGFYPLFLFAPSHLEPAAPKPFVACLVQKNGCSEWRKLGIKTTGSLDTCKDFTRVNPHSKNLHRLIGSRHPQLDPLLSAPSIPWMMISRNPYVRVLSAYLDKVQKYGQSSYYRVVVDANVTRTDAQKTAIRRNMSYREFIEALVWAKEARGGLTLQAGINQHYALQTSMCGQLFGLGYQLQLKLENMVDWYRPLVDILDLHPLVDTGWPTQDTCFISTPDHPCNGTKLLRDDVTGNQITIPPDSSQGGLQKLQITKKQKGGQNAQKQSSQQGQLQQQQQQQQHEKTHSPEGNAGEGQAASFRRLIQQDMAIEAKNRHFWLQSRKDDYKQLYNYPGCTHCSQGRSKSPGGYTGDCQTGKHSVGEYQTQTSVEIINHKQGSAEGKQVQFVASTVTKKSSQLDQGFEAIGNGSTRTFRSQAYGRQRALLASQNKFQQALSGSTLASHSTSAEQKLFDFYTPELASLVCDLYDEDFKLLGYSCWDGDPQSFSISQ